MPIHKHTNNGSCSIGPGSPTFKVTLDVAKEIAVDMFPAVDISNHLASAATHFLEVVFGLMETSAI